ncbi:Vacuolar protein-sorting-associated protein 37-like protein 2 [Bienertia sinuspersici]
MNVVGSRLVSYGPHSFIGYFWLQRGSQDQGSQSRPQDVPAQSWYPPSVADSSSSSRPSTPGNNSSSNYNLHKPLERADPASHVSPAEAAGIISALRDKSADELRKLLNDKEAYNQFLHSLEQVKTQNNAVIECVFQL